MECYPRRMPLPGDHDGRDDVENICQEWGFVPFYEANASSPTLPSFTNFHPSHDVTGWTNTIVAREDASHVHSHTRFGRKSTIPAFAAALCLTLSACQTTGPGSKLASDASDPCQADRTEFANSKTFFQDQIVSAAVTGAAVGAGMGALTGLLATGNLRGALIGAAAGGIAGRRRERNLGVLQHVGAKGSGSERTCAGHEPGPGP